MRHWSLVLSGLLISAVALPFPAQARPQRNYRQAFSLAQTAIDRCYQKKDLEECDRLSRIEFTLSTWCNQGDQNACEALDAVMQSVDIEFRRQAATSAYE
jgi:hypothetical protein